MQSVVKWRELWDELEKLGGIAKKLQQNIHKMGHIYSKVKPNAEYHHMECK